LAIFETWTTVEACLFAVCLAVVVAIFAADFDDMATEDFDDKMLVIAMISSSFSFAQADAGHGYPVLE